MRLLMFVVCREKYLNQDRVPAATNDTPFQLTTSQWIRLGELSQLAKKEPCQSAADW